MPRAMANLTPSCRLCLETPDAARSTTAGQALTLSTGHSSKGWNVPQCASSDLCWTASPRATPDPRRSLEEVRRLLYCLYPRPRGTGPDRTRPSTTSRAAAANRPWTPLHQRPAPRSPTWRESYTVGRPARRRRHDLHPRAPPRPGAAHGGARRSRHPPPRGGGDSARPPAWAAGPAQGGGPTLTPTRLGTAGTRFSGAQCPGRHPEARCGQLPGFGLKVSCRLSGIRVARPPRNAVLGGPATRARTRANRLQSRSWWACGPFGVAVQALWKVRRSRDPTGPGPIETGPGSRPLPGHGRSRSQAPHWAGGSPPPAQRRR
jgi:hypothetical protein